MGFRSLFTGRTGSYDVYTAQAQEEGQQSRLTSRKHSNTVSTTRSPMKRFVYRILSKLEQNKYKDISSEDRFHLALYEEGLLAIGTFSRIPNAYSCNPDKLLLVYPKAERPVLRICYEFKNDELAEARNPKHRVSRIPTNVNRVSDAIYRVLYGDHADEVQLYGFRIFEWLQSLEITFEYLKTRRYRRRNKCVWTKRQLDRIIPFSNQWPLIGDSSLMNNQWGPFVPHQNRVFEMFTVRISELGERYRMSRHVRVTDPIIPAENTPRTGNRSRYRHTRAVPDVRRSGSDVEQVDANVDAMPLVPIGPNPAPGPGWIALPAQQQLQQVLPGNVHVEEFLFRRQVAPRFGRFVFH